MFFFMQPLCGSWWCVCMRVLTRQCLTLLLLQLPLTVDVEGAAPAVGQTETLLLLPALAPGRVSHRLQTYKHTHTQREAPILVQLNFINSVLFYSKCNKLGRNQYSVQQKLEMNGVWWLRGANSRTEHAEWKEKSIWGTHYTEMDFLLKLHLFYMLCASRLHYSQCSTLQLGLSLGNMIFMLVLLNRTFYSRKFSGSFPLKGWQIVRRFFFIITKSLMKWIATVSKMCQTYLAKENRDPSIKKKRWIQLYDLF